MNKKYSWWYGLLAALVLVYLYITWFLAVDSSSLKRYNITADQLKLLSLTIVLPVISIWFATFFGAERVHRYVSRLGRGVEKPGFKLLGIGLAVLALSSPLTAIFSRILSYCVTQHQIPQATVTIINTHFSWMLSLAGFSLFLVGSYRLVNTIKKVVMPSWHLIAVGVALAVLGSLYTVATLSNPSRTVAVAPAHVATYAMNDFLIVTTIVIPNILVWAAGFYTVLFLRAYHMNVGGKLYKQALRKLNKGFSVVIVLSIALQFTTAASTSISGWGLSAVLAFVYVLLAFIALGYIFIALGAKGLSKLEEVT